MGIQKLTFFPLGTVPECREFGQSVSITDIKSAKQFQLGQVMWAYHDSFGSWGQFRYVKFKTKAAIGAPCAYSAAGHVTNKASNAMARLRAGAPLAAASVSTFGWIQFVGVNFKRMVTDKGIQAGDTCIKDQVTAGMLDTTTNTGTQSAWVIGVALASDSGSFLAPGKFFYNGAT